MTGGLEKQRPAADQSTPALEGSTELPPLATQPPEEVASATTTALQGTTDQAIMDPAKLAQLQHQRQIAAMATPESYLPPPGMPSEPCRTELRLLEMLEPVCSSTPP